MSAATLLSRFKVLVALAVGTLLIGLGGLHVRNIAVDGASFLTVGLAVCVLSAATLYYARRGEETLTAALGGTLFMVTFSLGGALLSYFVMSLGAPLVDKPLAAIDAALGVDWLAILSAVNERPWLTTLLAGAYHFEMLAVAFTMILLMALRRPDRMIEFCWLYALCGLTTVLLSGALPAEGAFVLHAPPADMRTVIPADSGVWHLSHFRALREGTMRALDIRTIEGLVTFPSFHTALSIALALAVRGMPAAFWPMALYAGLVVLSTVPIGGHYVIDVLGGAAIAVIAAPIASRLAQGGRESVAAAPARHPAIVPINIRNSP